MATFNYTFKTTPSDNAPTAFGPPWYAILLSITGATANASGTATFTAVAGTTVFDLTADGSGNVSQALSPAVELILNSQLQIVIDAGEEGIDTTTEFSSVPALPTGNAGAGTDPKMILRTSNDGGKTFNAPRQRSLGKIGEYQKLLKWPQLGRSNNRVLWVECAEPVLVAIVEADLDAMPEGR
ncbi:MAG TPA: hypothetical protein VHV78_06055 [Gemmatimonadaceae bacterium]|jgi:hypothetical protein|nr:hypothetical protein [Gemmatimonadaceae bacterium]